MKIEANEFNKEHDKAKNSKELEDAINGGFEAINKIAEDSVVGREMPGFIKEKDVLLKPWNYLYQKTYPYHRMIGDVQISLKNLKNY